ncbi:MAG: FAD-dependent oxidoreductase [Actinobacteria bacterium]|nr:FAD-dependent oxidoreductase [Actinomycetota bacterium]
MSVRGAEVSHWFAQLFGDEGEVPRRPALAGSREADVCIVGAGYTGLWTAYYLRRLAPELDVVVLEAEAAGFGASGRNGGAVIAQMNGSRDYWRRRGGADGALALERALQATVDEIGAVTASEGIDCDFAKNGVTICARTELELGRLRESVATDHRAGFGDADARILDREETLARIRVAGALGARFSPHCASMHPGKLVRGLAEAAERAGATIYEGTRVTAVEPHLARTARADVRARFVVRATEAYSESVEGYQRRIVPVHTSMLATAAIDDALWAEIGWEGREALLAEHPFLHLQHTADRRITIGGDDNRVPYHWGSRVDALGPAPQRVAAMYHGELLRLFPALREVPIEHTWQGVFGAPRAWAPGVGVDRVTGLAWAGGYVGEGVAPSNLAARVLCDVLLERDTDLARLPLVQTTEGRRWEPEPLRTVGAGVVWSMRSFGDELERRRNKPSRTLELGNRLAGYGGHLG